MTRVQTAGASLVAAIPAGILTALLVMVFLNHAENLKTMTQILVGATAAVTFGVALMPFGVLIFGGKSAKSAVAKPAAGAARSSGDEDGFGHSDEIVATDDEDTETVIYQPSEHGEVEELIDDDSDMFDTAEEEDLILSDDDLDLLDEPEDKQKKKKKK